MLAQGETVRLNAKQSVSLRVGDAGAVFVSVNNGKAAPLGSDGQVVTRQFVVESTERRAADAAAQTPLPSPTNLQTAPAQKPAPLSSPIAAAPQTVPPSSAPPVAPNPGPARAACRGHAVEATCRCDAKSVARTGTSARPSGSDRAPAGRTATGASTPVQHRLPLRWSRRPVSGSTPITARIARLWRRSKRTGSNSRTSERTERDSRRT